MPVRTRIDPTKRRHHVYAPMLRAAMEWCDAHPGPTVYAAAAKMPGRGECFTLIVGFPGPGPGPPSTRRGVGYPRPADWAASEAQAAFVGADLDRLYGEVRLGFGAPEG